MAKERQAVGARLKASDIGDDELDGLLDDFDQLTRAIGELADLYEPQREASEHDYPALVSILAMYP